MPSSIKLLLPLLLVVTNVFGDDLPCEQILKPENMGHHCCKSLVKSESFNMDLFTCQTSGESMCDKINCILNKRGILKGDDIDEEAARKNFEQIMERNINDKSIVEGIMGECLNGKYVNYLLNDQCPSANFFACVFVSVQSSCQEWKTNDDCNRVAELAQKCRDFVGTS